MIEIVKDKISDFLKDKNVSLAMIYNRQGQILWNEGRAIVGKTIYAGEGFCKDYIRETIGTWDSIETENVATEPYYTLPRATAPYPPMLKKLTIQPLNSHYFIYLDSAAGHSFNQMELEILKARGEILADMISWSQYQDDDEINGGAAPRSRKMQMVERLITDYAGESDPVLLLGATGVGKNFNAESIHRQSGRTGKFVVAGAPNLQENLFESTLFGHKKGAFTDAKSDRVGLVEEARGGTLLIDEISEVPISLQAKLLRFIETQRYRILGDSNEKQADIRIIAASNRNLAEAIEKNQFREDLYYRLNVLEINIPSLRERKEDIERFVMGNLHYLKGKKIGRGFMDTLLSHDWPGNFRELITVMKRAGISLKSPISGQDIQQVIAQTGFGKKQAKNNSKIEKIWKQLEAGHSFWATVKRPYLDRELNREETKEIIARGLKQAGGVYKNLLPVFNLDKSEYAKFMRFLYENRLK